VTTNTLLEGGGWNMRRVWSHMSGLKAGRAYRAGIAHGSRNAGYVTQAYEASLRFHGDAFPRPENPEAVRDLDTYVIQLHVGALHFLAHRLTLPGLDDSRKFGLLDALALVTAILDEELFHAAAQMGPVELRGCADCEGDAG